MQDWNIEYVLATTRVTCKIKESGATGNELLSACISGHACSLVRHMMAAGLDKQQMLIVNEVIGEKIKELTDEEINSGRAGRE